MKYNITNRNTAVVVLELDHETQLVPLSFRGLGFPFRDTHTHTLDQRSLTGTHYTAISTIRTNIHVAAGASLPPTATKQNIKLRPHVVPGKSLSIRRSAAEYVLPNGKSFQAYDLCLVSKHDAIHKTGSRPT